MHARSTLLAAIVGLGTLGLVSACGSDTPPESFFGPDLGDDTGTIDADAVNDTGAGDVSEDLSGFDAPPDAPRDVTPDGTPDGAECTTLGCACSADDECASGYCLDTAAGRICSELCDGECSEPGYTCRLLENAAGDVVRLCIPDSEALCAPCVSDLACGSLAFACVDTDDGRHCLPSCASDGDCPDGYACEDRVGAGDRRCMPDTGVCSPCVDDDGDGFGVGAECAGADCDDGDDEVFEGATEICDGIDNDCDLDIDEDFDLASDPVNCGACGVVCDLPNSTAICDDGACGVGACDEGWGDCDGLAENGCETDLTAPDACGTCAELGGEPGTPCGTCAEGTWVCTDDGAVACDGDPGDERLNACGGCGVLPSAPGDACGTCGSGSVVCDGTEATACAGDAGDDARNACGGCTDLDGTPGAVCGTCDSGEIACDGPEVLICAGDDGDGARNACGGCGPLDGAPGDPCGSCGLDALVCDGTDALVCDGETLANACGGCERLAGAPGAACGTCDTGAWVCDGADDVVCDGDEGDGARNACGGCGALAATPGTSCGTCGSGTWTCDGRDGVVCAGDEGDGARNACGGCASLANPPGTGCGRCGVDRYVCNGADATRCDGDTALNGCGGCSTLAPSLGTSCGVCGDGAYVCSGTEGVRCADVPAPTEVCNLVDDDCDGSIDEIGGCTVGVHRSFQPGHHFYTTSLAEASCCGFTLENANYFYLYRSSAPNLAPFYRCFNPDIARHLYTTDRNCEEYGRSAYEGQLGWIGTREVPGSIELYRLYNPSTQDHLYTTSLGEFSAALRSGWRGEPSAGWVFTR